MESTRTTLLARVKDPHDDSAWRQFNEIYFPVLVAYARRRDCQQTDAEDIAQQCMTVISRSIQGFDYDPAKGRFKNWLFRIVENKMTDFRRKRNEAIGKTRDFQRTDPSTPTPQEIWDRQWEQQHFRWSLDKIRCEVPAKTFTAFEMYALEQQPVALVSSQLGLTENQVYLAKSRILARLRQVMVENFGNEPADY